MRSEIVTMEQFLSGVQEELQEKLSRMYPQIRVQKHDVSKVQGESYRGISVQREDRAATPVFRMDDFYRQLGSKSFHSVFQEIMEKVVETLEKPIVVIPELFKDYDFMKSTLMTEVIGTADNAARLAELPHTEIKDMSVIYRFLLDRSEDGRAMSVTITNDMLKSYGISTEQLHQDALKAMKENHPYSVRPMGAVLGDLGADMGAEDGPPDLFVAMTDTKMYGASVIAQPEFMEKASEIVKGDFYVLPSSIHEVLLLKDDGSMDFHDLQAIVESINEGYLMPSDKLTSNVYHYDAAERVFETAQEHADRMAEKTMEKRPSVLAMLREEQKSSGEHAPRHHRPPERSGTER